MSELKTNLEQILQEKTTKLIPENIKRKVEIFDVTGTDGDVEVEELQAKIIETKQEIADTRRDLENSAATVTGTGENVTLNQTAEATFKKLGVSGNSKQVSYEGYNIINISNQVNRTDSGVEITADVEKQIIKFNGTIGNTYCTSAKLALSEPLSTGVFRANFNSKCDAFIVFRSSDDTWLKSIQSSNNSAVDISTLSKPVTHIQFGIEHLTSGTNVNYEVGYQLTEGSELKPYEPYVGGEASPNPDYPQEIHNVEGKNLLNTSLQDMKTNNSNGTWNNNVYSINGITITVNSDLSLVLNGTCNSQNTFLLCNNKSLEAGTYILNGINAPNEEARIYIWDNNWDNITNTLNSTQFTLNENKLIKVGINIYNNKTYNNFEIKPMISKEGGEYVPYNSIQIKSCNKNLIQLKDGTYIAGPVSVTVANGIVNFDGNTDIYERNIYIPLENPITLHKNDTFTFSCSTTSVPSYKFAIRLLKTNYANDANSFGKTYNGIANNKASITYTQQEDETFNYVLLYMTSDTSAPSSKAYYQLEVNSIATDYVEHKQQTFIFPLGNEKLMLGDYLADDGIHHTKWQSSIDGTGNWSLASEGDTTNGISIYGTPFGNVKNSTTKILMSNRLKFISRSDLTSSSINFITGGGGNTIVLNINREYLIEDSLNGFKTWLQSNPLAVEYELEQEVITPYTSQQQTVYDAMKKAISYEEQTNVSSSNTVSPIFTVTAFRDADLAIASLDNRVTLLED